MHEILETSIFAATVSIFFPVYRVFILVHRGDVYKQGIIWMQFDFLTWYSVYMDTHIYSKITFLLFFFNHRNFYLSI